MAKCKLRFENFSASGIDHRGAGFKIYVPGHAIGDKAVVADVPAAFAGPVRNHFRAHHPAVRITELDDGPTDAAGEVKPKDYMEDVDSPEGESGTELNAPGDSEPESSSDVKMQAADNKRSKARSAKK